MSAHCQKCGSRCHGQLCRFCAREERRDDVIGESEETDSDEDTELNPYECTTCHAEYRAPDAGVCCPECGGDRKRYVGELA